ncbi:hypothetical protein B0H63DRAFT_564230 [Podospora didyma]|uniref:Polyketide synthase n=1 Tax=Podospora didyma TaxID=330526 RepID=A0AAE0K5E2_9PEZI|nr:hypothetical protein B0H63DRAFT_564230 [Podospora didyma]
MSSTTLLLFGDQTGEVLPSIQELSRLAPGCQSLSSFFRKATDRLRSTIARAPAHYRRQFPSFDSPLELAEAVAKQNIHSPALATALLCISQFGHVILYLESSPRAIEGSSSQPTILGICTGLLTAAAVSCCRNLTEILSLADEVVQIAFQAGLEASQRSEAIDPSTSSWATLVTGFDDVNPIQTAVDSFNRECVLEPSRKAYISAGSSSSVTISGPPSTTADLFANAQLFQLCKKIPLPISAAFHASHLVQVRKARLFSGLTNLLLERPVQHQYVLSPSSGLPYAGETFSDLLDGALNDIFQESFFLNTYTRGLKNILNNRATLIQFGPVNSAKAIKHSMQAMGVELDIAELTPLTSSNASTNAGAVAIVGMSVRLPGSETLEEFWKVLEDGRDLHEKIRPDRFNIDTHCDPSGKIKNTTLTPYGVFIDRPGYFDTRLFNMSPREAAQTDPQQRLMLLTTYEALEMAGYTPNGTPSTDTRRIGSFIGQTSDDWREVNASQNVDTYFITGGIRAFGPGRLNYHFGWEGPSYSVDTACSSSAASIQLACSALLARECDTAVGGGANFLTASDLFAGLSRGSFLSKTGGCKTFDHDADGYVRADAVGVVVLKRLDDALADRDNILAVLRGAVTNHSAEAVSITHPHAETQERLFHSALNHAGIRPHDIDYAELHGTGTQAGDATESRSVTNVLARGRDSSNPLYIGTVKPNLGHGEAASGVTSLIKAILMLRKNMIPPHVGIKGRINQKLPPLAELNTHISFGKTPFLPRTDGDGKRRILINNFDAAGGNTSMVIEDPPALDVEGVDPRAHHVVAVSGKTPNSILSNTKRLLHYIRAHPKARLEDIAYTTTARRMHHVFRRAHAASSVDVLAQSLEKAIDEESWTKVPATRPQVVFLFTGQGSQYVGMASELFKSNATFREHLQNSARICTSHGFASFLPLITDATSSIAQATPVQIQLSIVAIELAVAALWKSIGVAPTAVLGHSLGEYAALCTAGVLSLSDCLYLVGKRATLMVEKSTPGTHSMLAIQSGADRTKTLIDESGAAGCEIACVNGPASTVVSGPVDQIAQLQQQLSLGAVKTTLLEVQFAFHSAQMDDVLDDFSAIAKKVHFGAPSIPMASTVLGAVVTKSGIIDAEYLVCQTRGKVQFLSAVESLKTLAASGQQSVWVETGPNPTCLGLVRSTLGDGELLLPSLKRKESDWKILAGSVAKAFTAGLDIDWREFHQPYETALRLLELPNYAFDLKNYWIQYEGDWAIRKGEPAAIALPPSPPKNKLPAFSNTSLHRIESQISDASGIIVTFATEASEPKLNKALRGHLVNGAGLCPSSVYADMAFTAARYIESLDNPSSHSSMDIRDMEVFKPLLIQPGETRQIIRVVATRKSPSDPVQIKFSSQDGESHLEHAHCSVVFGDGEEWKSDWSKTAYLVKSRINHLVQSAAWGDTHKLLRPMVYKLFAALVDYDPKYQGMREVYMDSNLFEASANVKFNTTDADGTFTYSPYWIDSLAHLSGFVLNGADTTPADSVFISHGWGSMKIVGELSSAKEYQSYVRMQETKTRGVMAGDVYFFEGSEVVAICQDLKFQRIKRTVLNHLLPPTPSARFAQAAVLDADTSIFQQKPAAAPPSKQIKPAIKLSLVQETSVLDMDAVLRIVASEVGVEVSELSDDAIFADLGVDSLLSISITAKLGASMRRDIPATLFTECLTVGDLRSYFAETLTAADDASSSDSSSDTDDGDLFTNNGRSAAYTPVSLTGQSAGTPAEHSSDIFKKIIATEVGVDVEEIDDDTQLADLGVDSLLSLAILGAIKTHTGQVLPSSFLLDHPTLGAIQSALGGRSKSVPSQQLFKALEKEQKRIEAFKAEAVLLQGSALSHEPSLFLLPDGSGSASSYVGLPRLSLAGAVYGLNSPFLDMPKAFTIPLQDAAAMYVNEIRRVQPRGPYHLAGWSIGGTYAFEVASQLMQRHGERVDSLTLIDAPCPKSLPPLPIETIELLEKVGAFDGLKNKRAGTKAAKMRDGVRDHFAGSVNSLKQYRPTALSKSESGSIKSVTALWARHGVWETVGQEIKAKYVGTEGAVNAARDWIMDPRQSFEASGWETILPGARIKCEVIVGDHFSIMRKPGIVELGKRLADAVKRPQE